MKFTRFCLIAITLPLGYFASGQVFAQTPPRQLSVLDIRQQVESRLLDVWTKLPQLPNGEAIFDFTIKQDGSLGNLRPFKGSGNAEFDRAAAGTIKRVIPLPTLPAHLQVSTMNLRATFKASNTRAVQLGFAPLSFGSPAPPQTSNSQKPPVLSNPPVNTPDPNTINQANRLITIGVTAMNTGDYNTAIPKLEEAVKMCPQYPLARKNLAIAYNNYGLKLRKKPAEALKVYHKAMLLDPGNSRTQTNLDAIITILGKNPQSFEDRKLLGDNAFKSGDRDGAKVEYMAALKIKNDPAVRKKLDILTGQAPKPANPPKKAAQPPVAKKPTIKQAATKPKIQKPTPKPKPKPVAKTARTPAKTAPQKAGSSINQKLNTVYSRLDSLEKKFFGKTFKQDDILARLVRLEKKAFGSPQAGSPKRRLDALLIAN